MNVSPLELPGMVATSVMNICKIVQGRMLNQEDCFRQGEYYLHKLAAAWSECGSDTEIQAGRIKLVPYITQQKNYNVQLLSLMSCLQIDYSCITVAMTLLLFGWCSQTV